MFVFLANHICFRYVVKELHVMSIMVPQHASVAEPSSEEVFKTRQQQNMSVGAGACVRSTAKLEKIANTAGELQFQSDAFN